MVKIARRKEAKLTNELKFKNEWTPSIKIWTKKNIYVVNTAVEFVLEVITAQIIEKSPTQEHLLTTSVPGSYMQLQPKERL